MTERPEAATPMARATNATSPVNPTSPLAPSAVERRTLLALADELERDLALVADLTPLASARPRLEELAADARAQLERSRTAAVITLVGATGAGKSTLLNALVGLAVAREGEDRPTTSAPVVYRPRDADLRELLDGLPGAPPRVVDYDPERGARGGWAGQVLVDAPDTNSVETLHREVVAALAARSDVLVVVAHRQSIAELSSARFVDLFAGRRGMLFVLNRVDELTEADREALLAQLRGLAVERFRAVGAPVLAVSARAAQRDPSDASWRALVGELGALATAEVALGVRRRNALGAVGALAALARERDGAIRAAVQRVSEATRAGAAAWRGDVGAAIDERLELRARDLAAMLWNDAAKGWDGPGGYALRAGGLATLGLGAGAALARHNPALAAGAAVGALALDRAREALRERGFQSSAGLLPGEGDLARWHAERFSAARLAAEELFVSEPGPGAEQRAAARAGVPSGAALGASAVAAAGESWERLLAVDLPAAARAALPRAVPWVVDLPVYGLGGWVVVQAALGLFRGRYVGVELLLTAAIVAGAWLFVCRALVRRVLTARAARLLAAVRSRVAERLAREEELAVQGQRQLLAPLEAAMDRLAEASERWRARLRA